jgi:hypothetical protein
MLVAKDTLTTSGPHFASDAATLGEIPYMYVSTSGYPLGICFVFAKPFLGYLSLRS